MTEDLSVWLKFIDQWNACYSIIEESGKLADDMMLYTDASDWGMGGWNITQKRVLSYKVEHLAQVDWC